MHKTALKSYLRFCYGFSGAKTFRDLRETGPRRLNGSEAEGDLVLIKTSLFCCVNQVVPMLTSWHLREKSREVCIKARSPPANLTCSHRPGN